MTINTLLTQGLTQQWRTALACGVYPSGYPIGRDNDDNDLYTILDRAKENGLATGVITNSYLSDATPAYVLNSFRTRIDKEDISDGVSTTDVDSYAAEVFSI